VPNIFELPDPLPAAELFEPLAASGDILVERIISRGQQTPLGHWYDQDKDEWVMLVQGEAELSYSDGSSLRLQSGDYVLIPARQKHRVEYTSTAPPCIWLAIHATTLSNSD
jgi:cupin 2 domain-containing protein